MDLALGLARLSLDELTSMLKPAYRITLFDRIGPGSRKDKEAERKRRRDRFIDLAERGNRQAWAHCWKHGWLDTW